MSFWTDVLAHTGLFIGFLPIFFFLYVSPNMIDSLVNDITSIIKPELTNYALLTSLNNTSILNNTVKTLNSNVQDIPAMDTFMSKYTRKNADILLYTAITCGVMSFLLLVLAVFLEYRNGGNITEFLLANIIVLCFIMISEFAIVGIFFRNFVVLDGDFIKATYVQMQLTPYSPTIQPSGQKWDSRCDYMTRLLYSIFPSSILKSLGVF